MIRVDDDGRFPAPLQDMITAYAYLLHGLDTPSRILVSGDSCGATRAMGFSATATPTRFSRPGSSSGSSGGVRGAPLAFVPAAGTGVFVTG
ncbi:uncharacterized protein BDW47DRAFT_110553 [Aspergillus candidus]|uniref:Uncharacterized protein n=1 Tax=Aspergillus candidus TaxID=41067 RepID=A0A2I2F4B2_ASPCN|nr:hypothetical protein BDW47DRAFT_110553 [Aspergillus candidus]PLB35416.1 hypothetical protein BDW47DRAFT_110553 [Aspergillus candidus]